MPSITVLYFAGLRELAGRSEERLALAPGVSTVSELIVHLERKRPELTGRFASVRVAVNEAFVSHEHALSPGDVVALIPPVAGG
jgi:molybdopterin converting factor subunit 1